jgi:TRAP-type C4-dicarboxylate transport system permease small subunit
LTWAPQTVKSACDVLGTLLYLLVGSILTWRLTHGAFEMYEFAETTGTLAIPRWYSFPYGVACMALLLIVTMYTLVNNISETRAASAHE